MTRPVCAIVGAGEGLGRALSAKFAGHGFDLALVSRTEAGSAAAMRSRVSGRSRMRAPSACATALPMAAAVGPIVHSPTPSERCSSASTSSTSIGGTSLNRRIG